MSDPNGTKLANAGVKLFSVYGGTEFGVYINLCDTDEFPGGSWPYQKTREDWSWMGFSEERLKIRWVPQGDGTYELHLLVSMPVQYPSTSAHLLLLQTCDKHHPAIENLLDTRGYATNDLFIPHPTKKGLWKA